MPASGLLQGDVTKWKDVRTGRRNESVPGSETSTNADLEVQKGYMAANRR
jgi:hypothetical protein